MIINILKFVLKSKRLGYSLHSPYLYKFVIKVLKETKNAKIHNNFEKIRYNLLKNKDFIKVNDLGAGSRKQKSDLRQISKIAKYSLTSPKYCTFLYNLVEYVNAKKVLELGTSLGISALYLKSAKNNPNVFTVEGSNEIANIAKQNFSSQNLDINIHVTSFIDFFDYAKKNNLKFDLFFIDGHHTKEATLKYFELSKQIMLPNATFIFDDIRWSAGMYEAWTKIRTSDYKGAAVELFKMGVILMNDSFIENQYEIMRF